MRLRLIALWAALPLCGSCDHAAGGLVVDLSTGLAVPAQLDSISVAISDAGALVFSESYDLSAGLLPASIALAPTDSSRAAPAAGSLAPGVAEVGLTGDTLVIDVSGSSGTVRVIERSASVVLPIDAVRVLALPLDAACQAVVCDEAMTCVGGSCVDESIDASALPEQG